MYRSKSSFIYVVLIFVFAIVIPARSIEGAKKIKAPDFNLFDVYGKVHRLSKSRKNFVVLNFFTMYSPSCRLEIPCFVRLSREYKKRMKFFSVLLDKKSSPEKIKKFVKKYKIKYPVLIANLKVVTDYGGIRGIPTTFFIDEKGFIIKKHIGYLDEKNLKKILDKFIK